MDFLVLTKTGGILGPFATALGLIINYIYMFLDMIGIPNIALSIILFTLIVNVLMVPLTLRQQRFTKMSAIMNPEINKIRNKYKGKTDQQSQMKMQTEVQAVYKKYGTSATSGCLPMLITLPILFALYRVILNIPAYIEPVRQVYLQIAEPVQQASGGADILTNLMSELGITVSKFEFSNINNVVDMLFKVKSDQWGTVASAFSNSPSVVEAITANEGTIAHLNSFIGGLNIADSPIANGIWPGILIPILAAGSQFVSTKIASASQSASAEDNPMGGSMKMMNTIFPIMSFFICLTIQVGVGLYWIANAVFRTIITVVLNKYIENKDMDEIIQKNREKAEKKAEKRGGKPSAFEKYASMNTKQLESEEVENKYKSISEIANTTVKKDKLVKDNDEDYKPVDNSGIEGKGSISDYANMLKHK